MDDNLPFGDPGDFDSLFNNGDQLGGSLFDTDALMPDVFGSSPWSPVPSTSSELPETMVTGTVVSTTGSLVEGAAATWDNVLDSAAPGGDIKIPIPRVSSLEQTAVAPHNHVLESSNWMQAAGGNIIHVSEPLPSDHVTSTTRAVPRATGKVAKSASLKATENQPSGIEQQAGNQANLMNVKLAASNSDVMNPGQAVSMATSGSSPGIPLQLKGTVLQPAILHQLPNNTQLQKLLIQGNPNVSGINIPGLQTLQAGGQQALQLVSVQQPGQPMTLNTHGLAVNTQSGQLVIQRPAQVQVQQASSQPQPPAPAVSQIQALQIQASSAGSQLQGIQVNSSSTPNILFRTVPGAQIIGGQNLTNISLQQGTPRGQVQGQLVGDGGQMETTQQQQHQQQQAQQVTTHTLTTSSSLQQTHQVSAGVTSQPNSQPQHSIGGLQGLNIGNGINNVNIVASEAQVFNNIMLGNTTTQAGVSGQTYQLNTGEHTGLTVKIGGQIVNLQNLQGIQNVAQLQQRLQNSQQNIQTQQQVQQQRKTPPVQPGIAASAVVASSSVEQGTSGASSGGMSNPVVLSNINMMKLDPTGGISQQQQQQNAQLIRTQTAAVKPQQPPQQQQVQQQLQQQPQQQQQQQLIQVNVPGGKVLYLTPQQIQLLQHKAKLQQQQRASAQQNAVATQQQQTTDVAPRQQQLASQLQQLQPKTTGVGSLTRTGVTGSRSVGGKHPASATSVDAAQMAASGAPAPKKRARGKQSRSQSSASSEMSQLSPVPIKSYHSPASVQSLPPESPGNPSASQMHPVSPAGSMGPPSNIYMPPSPAGSIGQRSIVHSIPPPSPVGSMGPPSNLQTNPPQSPMGSTNVHSLLPPSPAGSIGRQSNVQSINPPQSPMGNTNVHIHPPPSPVGSLGRPSGSLQGNLPQSPLGSILSHLPPSPAGSVKSQVAQSPQSLSQQPMHSPMGPGQTVLPPNSLAGVLNQLNQQQQQQRQMGGSHGIKIMANDPTGFQNKSLQGGVNSHNVIYSQSGNVGNLPLQTASSVAVQKGGLDQLGSQQEQEGALPPDLEQIDLFSPAGDNLDIFDSNNDLLDTVGKDLLGTDEHDDGVNSLNLTSDPTDASIYNMLSTAAVGTSGGGGNKTSNDSAVPKDDVLQYYIKQLRDHHSNTKEALQQSIEAMVQQKDLMARQQTPASSQQNLQQNLQQQQAQPQQQQLPNLGGQATSEPLATGGSRPDVIQTQEDRLKHVFSLAKRQREIQAQALARQQRTSSVDTALSSVNTQGSAEMHGKQNVILAGQPGVVSVQGDMNQMSMVSSTVTGLPMKQTRSLSDTAVQQHQRPPPVTPEHSNPLDHRTNLDPPLQQQQGNMRKLQQLLEAGGSGNSPWDQSNPGGIISSSNNNTTSMANVSNQMVSVTNPMTARNIMGNSSSSSVVSSALNPGLSSSSNSQAIARNIVNATPGHPGATATHPGATAAHPGATAAHPGATADANMAMSSSSTQQALSFTTGAPSLAVATQQGPGVQATGGAPLASQTSLGSGPRMGQLQAALQQIQRQASAQGLSQEQVLSALKVALREDGQQNVLTRLLRHAMPGGGGGGQSQAAVQSTSTAPQATAAAAAVVPPQSPSSSSLHPGQPQQLPQQIAMTTEVSADSQQPATGSGVVLPVVDGSPIKRTPVVYLNPKHEELLKRIQDHIRILHRTPNRTTQQNDFMKQLMDGEKRILRFGRIEALKLQNAQLKNQQGGNQAQQALLQMQGSSAVSQSLIGSLSADAAMVTSSLVTPQSASSGLITTVTTQSITRPLTPADVMSGSSGLQAGSTNSTSASVLQQQQQYQQTSHLSSPLPTVVAQVNTSAQNSSLSNQFTSQRSTIRHPPPAQNAPLPETLKGLLAEDEPLSSNSGNVSATPSSMATTAAGIMGRLMGSSSGDGLKATAGGQTGNTVTVAAGGVATATGSSIPGSATGDVGGVSAELAKQKIERLLQLLAPSVRQQLVARLGQMNPQEQQAFYRQQVSLIAKMQKLQQLKAQQQQQQNQSPGQPGGQSVSTQPAPGSVQIDRPLPNASLVKQLMRQPDTQMDSTDQLDGTSRHSAPRVVTQPLTSPVDMSEVRVAGQPVSATQLVVSKSAVHTGQQRSSLQNVQLPPSKSSLQMLTRPQLFQLQLKKDQQGALRPDATSEFKNYKDAIKRLIKYHVWQEKEESETLIGQADAQFSDYSDRVLGVMDRMLNKYQQLIFNESLRDSPSAERVMVERMFLAEERQQLERDRLIVRQNPELFKPTPYIPSTVVKQESLNESFSDESECGNAQEASSMYQDVKDCKVVLIPLPGGATNYDPNVKVKSEGNNGSAQVKEEPMEVESMTSEVKTERFEEGEMGQNVPSPSYTVQNSGQGLRMVFKSSPAHSPCPSPSPSAAGGSVMGEEPVNHSLSPAHSRHDSVNHSLSPAHSRHEPVNHILSPAPSQQLPANLFNTSSLSPALSQDDAVNHFSDISDIETEEAGPQEMIDRSKPQPQECDNNNSSHKLKSGATSSFENQYEEFLRKQSIKDETTVEGVKDSTNPLPPFLDYAAITSSSSSVAPKRSHASSVLRSLGFDTIPSNPGNNTSSPADLLDKNKSPKLYPGCTTLAGLLMGSDSDSEEKSQPTTSSSQNPLQAQQEPIEIDLTLSPSEAGTSQEVMPQEVISGTEFETGDKAEMQNAIESILGLEQDWPN